jgi:hypothetical protein
LDPSPEVLWSLRKDGHRVECELTFQGESNGWDCRYLFDGERTYQRRFVFRQGAWLAAEAHRTRLLAEGWNPADDY